MRVSRWMLLAAILVIAAVFIIKEAVKGRNANRPAAATAGAEGAATGQSSSEAGPLPGTELAAVLNSGRPTIADFGKGWCQPCKAMVPVLERAAREYKGKANVVFVDMEAYPAIAGAYRINVMPTQILFDAKGKEVTRHIGYMGTEDVERELAALGVKK